MNDRPNLSITMMSGPQDGRTFIFALPTGKDELVITLGRREECDIGFGFDSQVSRMHARLIYDTRDMEYYLEDAESRNGTFIGQNKVKGRVTIRPGELFRVGRTWLRLDPPSDTPETHLDHGDIPF